MADKKELNKFYAAVMNYEQISMKEKLLNLTKLNDQKLDEDFDKNIENAIYDVKYNEKIVIEGDYSYNFSVKFF